MLLLWCSLIVWVVSAAIALAVHYLDERSAKRASRTMPRNQTSGDAHRPILASHDERRLAQAIADFDRGMAEVLKDIAHRTAVEVRPETFRIPSESEQALWKVLSDAISEKPINVERVLAIWEALKRVQESDLEREKTARITTASENQPPTLGG